jgi:hypothetical protein
MELMLVATGAILLPFDALWVQALVLHGEVVAVLTLAASEDDLFARHLDPFLKVLSVRVGLFVGELGNLSCPVRVPTP